MADNIPSETQPKPVSSRPTVVFERRTYPHTPEEIEKVARERRHLAKERAEFARLNPDETPAPLKSRKVFMMEKRNEKLLAEKVLAEEKILAEMAEAERMFAETIVIEKRVVEKMLGKKISTEKMLTETAEMKEGPAVDKPDEDYFTEKPKMSMADMKLSSRSRPGGGAPASVSVIGEKKTRETKTVHRSFDGDGLYAKPGFWPPSARKPEQPDLFVTRYEAKSIEKKSEAAGATSGSLPQHREEKTLAAQRAAYHAGLASHGLKAKLKVEAEVKAKQAGIADLITDKDDISALPTPTAKKTPTLGLSVPKLTKGSSAAGTTPLQWQFMHRLRRTPEQMMATRVRAKQFMDLINGDDDSSAVYPSQDGGPGSENIAKTSAGCNVVVDKNAAMTGSTSKTQGTSKVITLKVRGLRTVEEGAAPRDVVGGMVKESGSITTFDPIDKAKQTLMEARLERKKMEGSGRVADGTGRAMDLKPLRYFVPTNSPQGYALAIEGFTSRTEGGEAEFEMLDFVAGEDEGKGAEEQCDGDWTLL